MPVQEKYGGRTVDDNDASPRTEVVWRAWDYEDEAAATVAVRAAAPTTYGFILSGQTGYLQNVTAKEIGETGVDKREFEVTCVYQVRPQEDDIEYSFRVNGQSVTLTHSLGTAVYTGGGRVPPDLKGGINVNPKGEIQGIAIERPQFTFSITKHWLREYVTTGFQLSIAGLVGSVNASSFGGLPRGCVKLNGVGGAPKGKKFPITYEFEYSPPEVGVVVGDIVIASREGWNYIDVYRKSIDQDESTTIDIPHTCFVHQVYPYGNFSILGLG